MPPVGTIAEPTRAARQRFRTAGWLLVGDWRGLDVWLYPNPPDPWWVRLLGWWA